MGQSESDKRTLQLRNQMTSTTVFPDEVLSISPSQQEGVCPQEEERHRVFGCELVQEAGILLRCPQAVMATGQNLLHRFFYRKSLKKFDVFTVAMGCVLLASKVEEKPKILREILFVFFRMYCIRKRLKVKPLELGGIRYNNWKNEVITIERYLLKELGFSFYSSIEHPHKYLLYYIKVLDGSNELAQRSWNYLNDACRVDLCLRYETRVIASAAIHLAAVDLHFPLPGGKSLKTVDDVESIKEQEQCNWWTLFGVKIALVKSVGQVIQHLYDIPKLTWLEPLADVEYLSPKETSNIDGPSGNDSVELTSPGDFRVAKSESTPLCSRGSDDSETQKSSPQRRGKTRNSRPNERQYHHSPSYDKYSHGNSRRHRSRSRRRRGRSNSTDRYSRRQFKKRRSGRSRSGS